MSSTLFTRMKTPSLFSIPKFPLRMNGQNDTEKNEKDKENMESNVPVYSFNIPFYQQTTIKDLAEIEAAQCEANRKLKSGVQTALLLIILVSVIALAFCLMSAIWRENSQENYYVPQRLQGQPPTQELNTESTDQDTEIYNEKYDEQDQPSTPPTIDLHLGEMMTNVMQYLRRIVQMPHHLPRLPQVQIEYDEE